MGCEKLSDLSRKLLECLSQYKTIERKGVEKTDADRLSIRKLEKGRRESREKIRNFLGQIFTSEEALSHQLQIVEPDITGLSGVNTDGETFATAHAEMFFSPWSTEFVHGSDSMFQVTGLIERILRPNERLQELKRVSWRRPITRNLRIAAVLVEDVIHKKMDALPFLFVHQYMEKPLSRS